MTAAPAYHSQFVLSRLPADDDELWWTVFGLWGYRIPRVAVCPGHVSPFRAFADAYFARYPSMIWKAYAGPLPESPVTASRSVSLTSTAIPTVERSR